MSDQPAVEPSPIEIKLEKIIELLTELVGYERGKKKKIERQELDEWRKQRDSAHGDIRRTE